jgi:hypothetical protein
MITFSHIFTQNKITGALEELKASWEARKAGDNEEADKLYAKAQQKCLANSADPSVFKLSPIAAELALTCEQVSAVVNYNVHLSRKFFWEPAILANGGGYFASKTAEEHIMKPWVDPLLASLALAGLKHVYGKDANGLEVKLPISAYGFSIEYNATEAEWLPSKDGVLKTYNPAKPCCNWSGSSYRPNTYHTGNGDLSQVEQIVKYRGNAEVVNDAGEPLWGEKVVVSGGSVSQYEPSFGTDDFANHFQVWLSDARRPVDLEFRQILEVRGISVRQYRITDDVFPRYPSDEFAPLGLLDQSNRVGGMPFLLGRPHYLYVPLTNQGVPASERVEYVGSVKGASVGQHDTHLTVEPITGAVVWAEKRVAAYMHAENLPEIGISGTTFLPENGVYWPLYYIDENNVITHELASDFDFIVYGFVKVKRWASSVLAILGAFITLFGVSLVCKAYGRGDVQPMK